MKFQTRVVGWKNKREFEEIYNCLYDEDLLKRLDGLERIGAWKCRYDGFYNNYVDSLIIGIQTVNAERHGEP